MFSQLIFVARKLSSQFIDWFCLFLLTPLSLFALIHTFVAEKEIKRALLDVLCVTFWFVKKKKNKILRDVCEWIFLSEFEVNFPSSYIQSLFFSTQIAFYVQPYHLLSVITNFSQKLKTFQFEIIYWGQNYLETCEISCYFKNYFLIYLIFQRLQIRMILLSVFEMIMSTWGFLIKS